MKKGVRVLLIALAILVLIVGIVVGVAMSWYSSVVPKRPSPTARPEAGLPWYDDFSDPASGWQTETDAGAEVGYREGVMRIFVKETNLLAWAFAGHAYEGNSVGR